MRLDRHFYHEAGHALMLLRYGIRVKNVRAEVVDSGSSIQRDGEAEAEDPTELGSRPLEKCSVAVAGMAASQVMTSEGQLRDDDRTKAVLGAEAWVKQNATFEHIADSIQRIRAFNDEVDRVKDERIGEATSFFGTHAKRAELEAVARELVKGPIAGHERLVEIVCSAHGEESTHGA